jgi:C-terminal processing protease CtpA/Prc
MPILLFSCKERVDQDSFLTFADNEIFTGEAHQNSYRNGWYVFNGTYTVDSSDITERNSKSLLLSSSGQDTRKWLHAYYYYLKHDRFIGDSICFSGKYKLTGTDNDSIFFSIRQFDGNPQTQTALVVSTGKPASDDSDWKDFSVKTAINENVLGISFLIHSPKNVQVRIKDCQVLADNRPLKDMGFYAYGAETDHEFDKGSGVKLKSISPQIIENLEILGRVWGFLKYYHPEVTRGNYNWDYELFRVLPQIASAENKEERNKLLNKWIDKYGNIKEVKDYTITDSSLFSRRINLDWLSDKNIFDEQLIVKLNRIKNAYRNTLFNYYVVQYRQQPYNMVFDRENPYKDITWEDQGFRILNLFRMWNVMEYCFPHTEMTDKSWDSLLEAYIPRFTEPESQGIYELSIVELGACINDSHGNIVEGDLSMKTMPRSLPLSLSGLLGTVAERFFYIHSVDVQLIEAKNGEIVVYSSQTPDLLSGDILLSVDGQSVNEIIANLTPYTIASNRAVLLQRILPYILVSDKSSLLVTFIRNGKQLSKTITTYGVRNTEQDMKQYVKPSKAATGFDSPDWFINVKTYETASKNILYLNVSDVMPKDSISGILNKNKHAKGMILDLRQYPDGAYFSALYNYLTPQPEEFICFSQNANSMPGNYLFLEPQSIGRNNPDYFKGKVAIIVNEGTISHGEYCAMAYRHAPRSRIIGSMTAGADGNSCAIFLVGQNRLFYTALGAFYPNHETCQRKGVKIDIPVRPTPEEIRDGRDVWMEAAIQYILE